MIPWVKDQPLNPPDIAIDDEKQQEIERAREIKEEREFKEGWYSE